MATSLPDSNAVQTRYESWENKSCLEISFIWSNLS